jgi:hypothetical protein
VFREVQEIQDGWDDLVDLHFEYEGGYLVVLRAYVDASTRDTDGLLSIAAYLMRSERVRPFRKAWKATFGPEKFSWADLIARSKQFSHLRGKEHDAEHGRLVSKGVGLVRENIIAGSIISCWHREIAEHSPTFVRGFNRAYSIACHMTLANMGDWARKNNFSGRFAYILEAGDDHDGEANHLLSFAAQLPEIAELYRWRGHSFEPKDAGSPFHAPDLFAWEWGKFVMDTGIHRKRNMRLSLVHLLNQRLDSYQFIHLSGPRFQQFLRAIGDLAYEQLKEEAAALAFSAPKMDVADALDSSEQKEPGEDHE